MLAVNTDKKIAIYSLGKTGTTTLIDTLPEDWHTTGEISADFMHTLFLDNGLTLIIVVYDLITKPIYFLFFSTNSRLTRIESYYSRGFFLFI